jgi:membrane protein
MQYRSVARIKPHRRRTFGRWKQRLRRRWKETRVLAVIVARELIRTRVYDVAAGLAFWSMMSMVPLLLTITALLSLLHLPNLYPQLLATMALLVPPDALALVERMVGNLLRPHTGVLSFGILSYIWSTTGGFTALIAALNIAYDVVTPRSWIRDRLQALLLAFTSGGLLTVSMLALLAGPDFAHFVGQTLPIPPALERLWPIIRLSTVFVGFVLALELVYFLGPNLRQRFKSTLPGAIFAIALWFAGSAGLAFYLEHMSNFSRMYGGMGAILALMFWIYLMALATLIGAEMNAELAKRRDSLLRGHQKAAWKLARERQTERPASAAGWPAA